MKPLPEIGAVLWFSPAGRKAFPKTKDRMWTVRGYGRLPRTVTVSCREVKTKYLFFIGWFVGYHADWLVSL